MEVIEEEPGHQAGRVGRFPGQGIFDQGTAVFAQVNGMHAHYRWAALTLESPIYGVNGFVAHTKKVRA